VVWRLGALPSTPLALTQVRNSLFQGVVGLKHPNTALKAFFYDSIYYYYYYYFIFMI
jgi:hypothetical protein